MTKICHTSIHDFFNLSRKKVYEVIRKFVRHFVHCYKLLKKIDKIKKSSIHYIVQGAKNNFVSFARWQRKHVMTNFYERRIPSMRKTVLSS